MTSTSEVFRKKGDTWPPIYFAFVDDTGAVINLTDATVIWEQRPMAGGAWSGPVSCIVDSPATQGTGNGMPDCSATGDFIGHFVITQNTKVYTIPDDGYIVLHVQDS